MMILDAPSPTDAIWPRPARHRLEGLRRSARVRTTLGHPLVLFCVSAGLWFLPAIALARIDPDRAVAALVRSLERHPLATALGFGTAALYVVATALLLAVAGRRLTAPWHPAARGIFRVLLAPAILLSLAAWIALAAGGFFGALLWAHAVWP